MGHRMYCRYLENGIQRGNSVGGRLRINEIAKEMMRYGYTKKSMDASHIKAHHDEDDGDFLYDIDTPYYLYAGINALVVVGSTDTNNRYIRNIIIAKFKHGRMQSVAIADILKRNLIPYEQFGPICGIICNNTIYGDIEIRFMDRKSTDDTEVKSMKLVHDVDFKYRSIDDYMTVFGIRDPLF